MPSEPASSGVPPGVAAVASVVPGLGQTIAGRPGEGLAWFVGVVGGLSVSGRGNWPATAFVDLWMYNVYDAYRDAGARRSAKHTLLENYLAAFNPLNVIDPIGAPIVLLPAVTGGKSTGPRLASTKALAPFEIAFIGLGEEGLFRGFFFPAFTDLSHSVLFGAISSSLLFAYAHKFYNGQSTYALKRDVFAARSIGGLLFCFQTYLHRYDLRHSIFAHTWYDVVVEYRHAGGTVRGNRFQGGSAEEAPHLSGLEWKYVQDF